MSRYIPFWKYGLYIGTSAGAVLAVASVNVKEFRSSFLLGAAECSTTDISANVSPHRYSAAEHYPNLKGHTNIMAQCLTPVIYAALRDRVTSAGVTLDRCIQVGVDNPGHPRIRTVGLLAGDEESYSAFSGIFDPVIAERHGGYAKGDEHPTNLDHTQIKGGNLDPDFVISCRIRTCRNIRGFSLPSNVSRAERRQIESVLTQSLKNLSSGLKGRYFPMGSFAEDELASLVNEGLAFDRPSAYYCTATIGRDWPDSRGTWYNYDRNLVAFVNENEDQLKVISLQAGGNMKEAFERFCNALIVLEKSIRKAGYEWMWNPHLGFITSCPSNLGTALRASVFIKLPLLSQDPRFPAIIKNLRVHKRAVPELQHDGVFDLSNQDRLGISEVDLIQQVIDAAHLLLRMEKRLRSGRSIDHLITDA
ncbi:Creatine kinase B-type [Hypsibius exemplaris]|uniref:arginine kinase n=1 Tax=Hypsibius exemplaris TaxID=2072580 RepID=A0A1W0X8C5_HYPEX|nr:Creatine kinase B-type [Hypsibius exemplaris]